MGIRVVWTYVWLQQKQNPWQTPQNLAQNVLAPTYKPLPQAEFNVKRASREAIRQQARSHWDFGAH